MHHQYLAQKPSFILNDSVWSSVCVCVCDHRQFHGSLKKTKKKQQQKNTWRNLIYLYNAWYHSSPHFFFFICYLLNRFWLRWLFSEKSKTENNIFSCKILFPLKPWLNEYTYTLSTLGTANKNCANDTMRTRDALFSVINFTVICICSESSHRVCYSSNVWEHTLLSMFVSSKIGLTNKWK